MKVMYFVPQPVSHTGLRAYLSQVKEYCTESQLLDTAEVWVVVLTTDFSRQTLEVCKTRQRLVPSQKFIFLVERKELCFWLYRYKLNVSTVICYNDKNWQQELYSALEERTLEQWLYFKTRGQVIKIKLDQICYAESHYTNTHASFLYLIDRQQIQVPKNLRILEQENPSLWRSHQSYLLNPENVLMLDKTHGVVKFINGLKCPISRTKIKDLRNILSNKI